MRSLEVRRLYGPLRTPRASAASAAGSRSPFPGYADPQRPKRGPAVQRSSVCSGSSAHGSVEA
eukprot:3306701-Alexandrium_andersonii.AAC.1